MQTKDIRANLVAAIEAALFKARQAVRQSDYADKVTAKDWRDASNAADQLASDLLYAALIAEEADLKEEERVADMTDAEFERHYRMTREEIMG